ncbi:site-specific integrase [Aliifodinibius salicampi]|uniref:Site-specific integrase n=1 Tax=Fodinibius salicampi TaxID=1920655 RepID=A0ABT3PXW4_9BACT|nr:site-specific integrase [Fodinibius salicampi]MCW9712691.1 site-specific integrase [Fodinibius salicampi]
MYKLKTYIYIRKDKIDKNNKVPVYLRLTHDGNRVEISLKVKVEVDNWDRDSQRATGRNNSVNNRIEDALSKVNRLERKYIDEERPPLEKIKREFQGKVQKRHFYLQEWDKLLDEIQKDKNRSEGTYKKYRTTRNHFQNFLKRYTGSKDIKFDNLTIDLINDYFKYLRNELGFKHNTVVRYVKNTKVVLNKALKRGWINKDPFIELDLTYKETDRTCLSLEEVNKLKEKEITIDRLDRIRDYFLFSCYTGLSFSDISKTKKRDIYDTEGNKLLIIKRQKTGNKSYIPLLPTPLDILKKHNYEEKTAKELLFEVPSNQNYNAYLKELADICGIEKHLTTHVARHTFATTITLEQGVSLETVGNMLGHSQLRTTQIYSKVTQQKALSEMEKVEI